MLVNRPLYVQFHGGTATTFLMLDAQINDIVTTEAGLIEKFKGTSIAFKTAAAFNPDSTIQEFDKLWLPKAPQIAELRKAGASLA